MRQRRAWFDLDDESAAAPDVAIIGMPYDGSSSRKAGAALGPERLRALSKTSDPVTRRGQIIEGLTVRDFGDISFPDETEATISQRDYLDLAASRLAQLPERSFVLLLGGDNSVSIAGLHAFTHRFGSDTGVIWFDAHPDLFEEYDGNPDSHACALHRAMMQSSLSPAHIVLLGTRSFSRGELEFARGQEIETITAADWIGSGEEAVADRITARLKGLSSVYLAIDIDGFDSAYAPGTGYPMPGGVSSEAFFSLMERLFQKLPLRAMDLTEISPPLDGNDVTGFLGAQVVLEALGALATRLSR